MNAAILNDLTKCIGCGACAMACKQENDLPGKATKLDAYTWSCVEKWKGAYVKRQCMHCLDPTCASVCPVAALHRTEVGAVAYEVERCIGCRYCVQACPFDIPKYQWDSPVPVVGKCVMCYEKRLKRLEDREVPMGGKRQIQPACTEVCPMQATVFGDRKELVRVAKERIASQPERYVKHIYGLKQAGGASVLYISGVPFSQLGFRMDVLEEPYPMLTWRIINKIPHIVGFLGLGLVSVSWVINRRIELKRQRAQYELGEPGDES